MHVVEQWKVVKKRETGEERHRRGAAPVDDMVELPGDIFFRIQSGSITAGRQACLAVSQFLLEAIERGQWASVGEQW